MNSGSHNKVFFAANRLARAGELIGRFRGVLQTEGAMPALARTYRYLRARFGERAPWIYKLRHYSARFFEHTRSRGLASALRLAANRIMSSAPVLRDLRSWYAAKTFEKTMSLSVEPRRVIRQENTDYPPFAMLVENLHDGGLERVVIDLAGEFVREGIKCPIFVSGSAGRAAAAAIELGCEVEVFHGNRKALENRARERGVQVIFAHHCYDCWDRLSEGGGKIVEVLHNAYHWQRRNPFLADLRARNVKQYIAVSEFARDYAVNYLSVRRDSIRVVKNGLSRAGLIRPPLSRVIDARRTSLERPLLVHVANAAPQKNHLAILDAFEIVRRSYPNAELAFAGVIDRRSELGRNILARAASSGMASSIRFLGPLGRRDLSHLLSRAHIALLPSIFEGFSIASLEYTYFGLPIVLSPTGAAQWLTEKYKHVVLAAHSALSPDELSPDAIHLRSAAPAPEVIESIADAVIHILGEYELYSALALEAGRDWAAYSVEATGRNYLDVVKAVAV